MHSMWRLSFKRVSVSSSELLIGGIFGSEDLREGDEWVSILVRLSSLERLVWAALHMVVIPEAVLASAVEGSSATSLTSSPSSSSGLISCFVRSDSDLSTGSEPWVELFLGQASISDSVMLVRAECKYPLSEFADVPI